MAGYMVDELGMNFHTVDFKPQMDGSQTYFITTLSQVNSMKFLPVNE
jgi:hypothetical protein